MSMYGYPVYIIPLGFITISTYRIFSINSPGELFFHTFLACGINRGRGINEGGNTVYVISIFRGNLLGK